MSRLSSKLSTIKAWFISSLSFSLFPSRGCKPQRDLPTLSCDYHLQISFPIRPSISLSREAHVRGNIQSSSTDSWGKAVNSKTLQAKSDQRRWKITLRSQTLVRFNGRDTKRVVQTSGYSSLRRLKTAIYYCRFSCHLCYTTRLCTRQYESHLS